MQVVLPELDGRLLSGAVSFKAEDEFVPALQYARTVHRPDADGIALAAGRAAGWARLGATPRAERRVAIVLSDYPGVGGQRGHAVGLDSFASLAAILDDLAAAGYDAERGDAALVDALPGKDQALVVDQQDARAGPIGQARGAHHQVVVDRVDHCRDAPPLSWSCVPPGALPSAAPSPVTAGLTLSGTASARKSTADRPLRMSTA